MDECEHFLDDELVHSRHEASDQPWGIVAVWRWAALEGVAQSSQRIVHRQLRGQRAQQIIVSVLSAFK